MQGRSPLVVGLVWAWLGMAHAQAPDYIIELNNAPLKPLTKPDRRAASEAAGAQPSGAVTAPASLPAAPMPAAANGKPRPMLRIALVLPTESPLFGEAASVVRQGFDAASATDGAAQVVYVDEQENNVVARYRAAVKGGVSVIVGPLTRSGIAAIAPFASVPTLALNTFEKPVANPRLMSLSLSVEGEAKQVANLMNDDGRAAPLVVVGADPLERRLAEAFSRQWQLRAGKPPVTAGADDAKALGEAAAQADGVFLALESRAAAQVRAALPGSLAVYGTSVINGRQPEAALAGARFVDMPWFLMPEQPEVKRYPRPAALLTMQTERLYALGIDAYRLAVELATAPYNARTGYAGLSINGVTGNLRLGRDRQFERTQPVSIVGVPAAK
ncbi:hypothetical protein GCM10011289_18120 [Paludibacterium paludis]|uniref:Penicillin-binding protein activator n=1 Tax=Paludibacterium paludis TaxID=1225769 RepID=A0A918P2T2_9NEIS|nr:hypothetical protein GCM10011289_18120 [Paludibacterium paludis]